MTKTTNYQLNQWAKSDRIMMDDFNADNQKIDAALAEMPRIVTGTYTGTGTYGSGNPNTLTFDFAPKIIYVVLKQSYNSQAGMLILRGQTICSSTGSPGGAYFCSCSFSGNTVSWYCDDRTNGAYIQFNTNGQEYLYIALG